MEHPYRPNQAAATPHARVLAGPNRLRTLWHLALLLVPWSEVRFARPSLVNGEVVGVRVATTGGQEFELRGSYGLPLDELAMMIAPPVGIVLRARQRLPAELGGAPSGTP